MLLASKKLDTAAWVFGWNTEKNILSVELQTRGEDIMRKVIV